MKQFEKQPELQINQLYTYEDRNAKPKLKIKIKLS